jgi:TM2 domain-containing membrane protein YozV
MSYQYQNKPPTERTTCGIVALILGLSAIGAGLGIHKFLMGKTNAGILTIVLSLCTCGVFGIVCSIVEGIIYLTKTDDEWYHEYFVLGKDWF